MDIYQGFFVQLLILSLVILSYQSYERAYDSNKYYQAIVLNKLKHESLQKTDRFNNTAGLAAKVGIKVFYEALCPGSIQFFRYQLQPVTQRLGTYLNLHLIPYGYAQVKWRINKRQPEIYCQHGQVECYGNKLQACAIDVFKDMTKATLYSACLMQNAGHRPTRRDYLTTFRKCNIEMEIPLAQRSLIFNCAGSLYGSKLLTVYGAQTWNFKPNYLPYVVVNNTTLESDLYQTVCSMLQPKPPPCYDYAIVS